VSGSVSVIAIVISNATEDGRRGIALVAWSMSADVGGADLGIVVVVTGQEEGGRVVAAADTAAAAAEVDMLEGAAVAVEADMVAEVAAP